MEQEKQVGIVYEDLTKKEKIKFIKSIHNKLKNNIDLDIHEINFVMSSHDFYFLKDYHRINDWMYQNRNVAYSAIVIKWKKFDFCWQKVFRMLYLDSNMWETITQIVNRYVRIQDNEYTKFNIVSKWSLSEYEAYDVKFDYLPEDIRGRLYWKSKEIFDKKTKEYKKQEQKVYNNLKSNIKTRELFKDRSQEDDELKM